MSGHTHSLSEWAAMGSVSVGIYAAASVVYFLLVDADRSDFDPRPLVRRVVQSAAVYPLLREWDNARHLVREACRDVAALVVLLTTSPKGAMS